MKALAVMPRRMTLTLAIVGAGRVGRALGLRLRELGWTIGAVVTRSPAGARLAVRAIGAGTAYGTLTRHVVGADVVLIATPDGQIAEVAGQLAKMGGEEWRGKVVLHTSGALDRSVLEPLARLGAATGSMHPLQTFSGRAAPDLEGCIFALEGDQVALRVTRKIVRGLGGVAVSVAGVQKPAYHAAGAFVSGHVLGIVEAATRMLMEAGFSRRQAVHALLPLLRQTLSNFERLGPGGAWTGPLSRGDFATVRLHVAALKRFPVEYREAYAALARLSALLIGEKDAEAREQLEQALAEFET
jgi:predicted short-subunit dehydrogenase-like oxidoreductase (DUF2520 family)